jgi:hypothetical protein
VTCDFTLLARVQGEDVLDRSPVERIGVTDEYVDTRSVEQRREDLVRQLGIEQQHWRPAPPRRKKASSTSVGNDSKAQNKRDLAPLPPVAKPKRARQTTQLVPPFKEQADQQTQQPLEQLQWLQPQPQLQQPQPWAHTQQQQQSHEQIDLAAMETTLPANLRGVLRRTGLQGMVAKIAGDSRACAGLKAVASIHTKDGAEAVRGASLLYELVGLYNAGAASHVGSVSDEAPLAPPVARVECEPAPATVLDELLEVWTFLSANTEQPAKQLKAQVMSLSSELGSRDCHDAIGRVRMAATMMRKWGAARATEVAELLFVAVEE